MTRDSHDEWIDLNGPDPEPSKADHQEQARKDKAEAAKGVKMHAYSVYRRAGLKPMCAIRFMITHGFKLYFGRAIRQLRPSGFVAR